MHFFVTPEHGAKKEEIHKNIFVMCEMLITAYARNSKLGSCVSDCTLGSMYRSAFLYHNTEAGSRVRTYLNSGHGLCHSSYTLL